LTDVHNKNGPILYAFIFHSVVTKYCKICRNLGQNMTNFA